MSPQFEVRVGGEIDPEDLAAFAGLDVVVGGGFTKVTGPLDQSALHGLIQRIEALGLELIEVRRLRSPRPSGD